MADLRVLYEKLEATNIVTYIQSGNVIFDWNGMTGSSDVEAMIQLAIAESFGFEVPVIIRTADEIETTIVDNPFLSENELDIDKLHLTFLKDLPSAQNLERIYNLEFLPDRFHIIGRNVFIYCENGYGRSKITNDFFEKKLRIQATTRNWKTVIKLHELALSDI